MCIPLPGDLSVARKIGLFCQAQPVISARLVASGAVNHLIENASVAVVSATRFALAMRDVGSEPGDHLMTVQVMSGTEPAISGLLRNRL